MKIFEDVLSKEDITTILNKHPDETLIQHEGYLMDHFDDYDLPKKIYDKLKDDPIFENTVKYEGKIWKPHYINHEYRLVKYPRHAYMGIHTDTPHNVGEYKALMGVILYLNDVPEGGGGETQLYENNHVIYSVQPKLGRCFAFRGDLYSHNSNHLDYYDYKYMLLTQIIYSTK